MLENENLAKLSNRERDIMNILWNSDKPLVASDISKEGDALSINTVQSTLKSLLRKDLIEVADIVYSGTVLSRSYKPKLSENDYALKEVQNYFHNIDQNISTLGIISALLDYEKEDEAVIEELEEMIRKRKENLNGE